jgi:MoaA/NifB/PqqE/SkfB family radical SAM enzyme
MYGIEVGLVTNGVHMGEEYTDILPHCARWVGISFDSPKPAIYKKIRGVDTFDVVCENVRRLTARCRHIASDTDVTLKMLFGRWNHRQIYDFAVLAKELGCTRAHIKPVSLDRVVGSGRMKLDRYKESIEEQCVQAKALSDDTFKVDIVTHKLDDHYRKIVRFERCECTPLGGVFGADGWFHLCYNMRGAEGFRLVEHMPDPWAVKRAWGKAYHKALIAKIDPKACMRCGQTDVNQIIEDCVRQDKQYQRFP